MVTELKHLSGGSKQHFNNANRELIVNYYRQFGEEATRARFYLKIDTLERILEQDKREQKLASLNDIKKLELRVEIVEAGNGAARREVNALKEEYGHFVEAVSQDIARKLIAPLLNMVIRLPEGMRPALDPLDLTHFSLPAGKIKAKKNG